MDLQNLQNKKIGIWGHGHVGRSALQLFSSLGCENILLMDVSNESKELEERRKITYFHQETQKEHFLEQSDIIIPSPGIDIRPYFKYHCKILCEADLFALYWQKPIIAITGSLGKTTITTLLTKQLETQGLRVAMGGNIGIPMLSFTLNQESYDIAVLELSSFQLEFCRSFAPDLAIITNIYANHLDRHDNFAEYIRAKKNIYRWQISTQKLLIPKELKETCSDGTSEVIFFSRYAIETTENTISYYVSQDTIGVQRPKQPIKILQTLIPKTSFIDNWLIVIAALDVLGYSFNARDVQYPQLEHRLEKVTTINGIDFYNDSKGTVMEAVISAVEALSTKPIVLLLGGLSKGVSRANAIAHLQKLVTHIACFGREAETLGEICKKSAIAYSTHDNLETAFAFTASRAQPGYVVLLSPGGSSYDLYKDYQERGTHFKTLVRNFSSKETTIPTII